MMRKKLSVFVAFLMAIGFQTASLTAWAAEPAVTPIAEEISYSDGFVLEEEFISDEEAEEARQRIEADYEDAVFDYSDVYYGTYSSVYSCNYFYDQLSTAQQSLYDSLVAETEKVVASNVDFSDVRYATITYSLSYEEMREAFNAFYSDNPQYFFIINGYSFNSSIIFPKLHENFTTYSARKTYADGIKEIADSWLPQINSCRTILDKEKKLCDLLCNQITYEFGSNHQSIAGALVDGKCVCNGYAMAFSYFANCVGIDTIMAIGQNHAWNMVDLYGNWYHIDVTWIDGGVPLYNVSSELVVSYDTSANEHTINTDYYVNRTLPTAVKVNPVVPDSSVHTLKAAVSKNSVALSWDAVASARKYCVYKLADDTFTPLTVTTGTSYTVNDLDYNTKYGFLVLGHNGGEWSPYLDTDIVYVTTDSIQPGKPVVTVTAADGTATVQGEAVENATKYGVYYYLNGKYYAAGTTTGTSYTVKGLTNGTEYGFLVRSCVGGSWSSFTTDDIVYATPVTTKPTPTVTAADGTATLKWNAVDGATKYAVYYFVNGGYSAAGTTTGTTYTIKGLTDGTEYGFLVRSCIGGNWSSFTIADNVYATPFSTKPKLTVTASDGTAKLSWEAVNGATKYAVYYFVNGSYRAAGTTTDTTYTIKGLTDGTKYGFLVRSRIGGNWSSFTTADNVYATPVTTKPVPSVTSSGGTATLTWAAIDGATKYAVYYYLNGSYFAAGTTAGTSYTIKGLTSGTNYGFLVRSCIDGNWSSFTTADNVYVII
ncbi:MAG: fibronectin type III domain-containing protein [Oscillospiraceae bacterium]